MPRSKPGNSLASAQRAQARRWLVVFIALALLISGIKACALITGRSNPVDRTISRAASPAVYLIRRLGEGISSLAYIFQVPALLRENNRLKSENLLLERQIEEVRPLKAQNERLLALGRISIAGFKPVQAMIVARPYDLWLESAILNVGRNQGVCKGNLVLNEYGVVGKVTEIEASRCRVQLLTSPQFRIGAISGKCGEEGVIRGLDWHTLVFDYIPAGSKISLDEKVFSLGFETFPGGDDNRPRGVLIGTIVNRKVDKNGFLEITVEPAVNPHKLGPVLVMTR
jgi:rod shape-determining protein MreC